MVMPLIQKALHIHGVQVGSRTQYVDVCLSHVVECLISFNRFEAMLRLAQVSGIRPLVDKVFEFEQATEALAYLSKKQHFGKIVIRVA